VEVHPTDTMRPLLLVGLLATSDRAPLAEVGRHDAELGEPGTTLGIRELLHRAIRLANRVAVVCGAGEISIRKCYSPE